MEGICIRGDSVSICIASLRCMFANYLTEPVDLSGFIFVVTFQIIFVSAIVIVLSTISCFLML